MVIKLYTDDELQKKKKELTATSKTKTRHKAKTRDKQPDTTKPKKPFEIPVFPDIKTDQNQPKPDPKPTKPVPKQP